MAEQNKNNREPSDRSDRKKSKSDLRSSSGFQFPADYIDPILSATHRVWHVRDVDGNGSGPFKGAELRQRLDDGMVLGNHEVCREDWEDWRLAADVFPELGSLQSQIPLASASVFTDRNYQIERPTTAKSVRAAKKKKNLVLGIVALVVALLLTIGLCYLLATLV